MKKQVEIEAILRATKAITKVDLLKNKKSQKISITDVRRMYALLALKYTELTLKQIGELIGKDHASILHYSKTGTNFLEIDKEFSSQYNLCESFLLNTYFDFRKEQLLHQLNGFLQTFQKVEDPFVQITSQLVNASN
jgi:hypothetical protein